LHTIQNVTKTSHIILMTFAARPTFPECCRWVHLKPRCQ